MKTRRIGAWLILALTFVLATAQPANAQPAAQPTNVQPPAHPLGNFSVNRYDGVVVASDEIRIDHVEDLAEIPTAQVQPQVNESGLTSWAERRCEAAVREMELAVDERPGELRVRTARAQWRAGQAGLRTLRVECALAATGSGSSVVFRSDGGTGSVGWREITARGDRMTLTSSDVPATSVSERLTRYPEDMLSAPLDRRQASLRIREGGPALREENGAAPTGVVARGNDGLTGAFTDLVARRQLTVGFAALALLIALALGTVHALAPGHGKTIMAAYAVTKDTRKGTRRDVFTLGMTVTVTHTAGVLVLGLLIASGSVVAPASVYPWLGIASGALVAIAGTALLRRAVKNARQTHAHGHGHENGHGHGHGHGHERGRTRQAALMGFAGGMVPSPSAVLVLLGAAAIGQAWFGVLLVLAYGAGLALTLVLIGLFLVGSSRALVDRLTALRWLPARSWRLLPVGTATAVVVVGIGLVLRSLPAAIA